MQEKKSSMQVILKKKVLFNAVNSFALEVAFCFSFFFSTALLLWLLLWLILGLLLLLLDGPAGVEGRMDWKHARGHEHERLGHRQYGVVGAGGVDEGAEDDDEDDVGQVDVHVPLDVLPVVGLVRHVPYPVARGDDEDGHPADGPNYAEALEAVGGAGKACQDEERHRLEEEGPVRKDGRRPEGDERRAERQEQEQQVDHVLKVAGLAQTV